MAESQNSSNFRQSLAALEADAQKIYARMLEQEKEGIAKNIKFYSDHKIALTAPYVLVLAYLASKEVNNRINKQVVENRISAAQSGLAERSPNAAYSQEFMANYLSERFTNGLSQSNYAAGTDQHSQEPIDWQDGANAVDRVFSRLPRWAQVITIEGGVSFNLHPNHDSLNDGLGGNLLGTVS